MPDVPGDSSTTSTISLGGTVAGAIEVTGDHDWYRITLTAGQQIEILLTAAGGDPMEDPYLRIRNSSGEILAYNDDGGAGRNARLGFEAPSTGTYYIDAAAWTPDEPVPDYSEIGTYELSVKTFVAPTEWTNDQIAAQLTTGYWEGATHHFNATQGGTITVNLSALTSEAQNLARNALALWSDVIGVTFSEVSGSAQITFDDDDEGAHANAQWNGSIISSADVNIAEDWASGNGSGLNSYRFQTYLHEVGHALGLGHAGNYNEEASYPFDVSYSNDGWPITVMSYFALDESSYYDSRGFSTAFIITPMIADVIAMGNLYGLSTTTRTGDTVYGIANSAYGTFANREVFNAAVNPRAGVTIFDSGGIDTLSYSTFSANQRIDLNPETFSNVAGYTGNLSIARGVVVENALGGGGADTLIGNSVANRLVGNGGGDTLHGNAGNDTLTGGSGVDSLTGGVGADTFSDSRAKLNGDTIEDFSSDDRILFSDATLSSFTYSLSASVLTYSGGSLILRGGVSGQFTAAAASTGGVELRFSGSTGDSGQVRGGSGNDELLGTAASDSIFGEGGHDIVTGGLGADFLYGGDGNDTISSDRRIGFDGNTDVDEVHGGAGNDMMFAGYGDIVDGGAGFDTLNLSYIGASHGITGDTKVLFAGQPLTPGGGTVRNIERFDAVALTQFADTMVIGDQADPATAYGYDGDDHLIGQENRVVMYGGNGNDLIVGSTVGDVLYGENGNDTVIGGPGGDELWGGAGNDRFLFNQIGATDKILDFERGADRIDLADLDANAFASGNQAFSFIGEAGFSGVAGQLRAYAGANGAQVVAGDVNGDRVADITIEVSITLSGSTLTSGDFAL